MIVPVWVSPSSGLGPAPTRPAMAPGSGVPPPADGLDVRCESPADVVSPWNASCPASGSSKGAPVDGLSSLGMTLSLDEAPVAQSLSRRVGIGVAVALSLAGAVGLGGCSASTPPSQSTSQGRVLPLVSGTDPVLHTRATEVTTFDDSVRENLANMARTMHMEGGVGLAAPQVGIPQRLIVVRAGNGLVKMVNPKIVSRSGDVVSTEGCLSLPGRRYTMHRATHVVVEAQDENGQPFTRDSKGLEAVAMQHEIDHLDGVTIADRGKPSW